MLFNAFCRQRRRKSSATEADSLGASRLGLEAQRQTIDGFATSRRSDGIAWLVEVERGRNPDRPERGKALHLAKIIGASVVIAKLGRLSRNAVFLLTLRDSGVRFLAVDMPEANDLSVRITALVAQAERGAISPRTKEALSIAKARGGQAGQSRRCCCPSARRKRWCGAA